MRKFIVYIIVAIFLAAACEDVYHPKLKDVENLLVIEARITNEKAQNYIRLTKSIDFNSDSIAVPVNDATIILMTSEAKSHQLDCIGNGYYDASFVPEVGKSYKLQVFAEGEEFVSSWETMPPMPEIGNFKVGRDTNVYYTRSTFGQPIKHEMVGFRVKLDLPINQELKYYMFNWKSLMQFVIPGTEEDMGAAIPPPDTFAWKVTQKRGMYNIAGPAKYVGGSQINKHPLMFRSGNYYNYIDTTSLYSPFTYGCGWIFEIDQFGLTENTFRLYEDIIEQLEANGQLFDPMYTQVEGNMRCVSNLEKEIIGGFELNSVKKRQFYITNVMGQNVYFHEIDPIINLPKTDGQQPMDLPYFWQIQHMK